MLPYVIWPSDLKCLPPIEVQLSPMLVLRNTPSTRSSPLAMSAYIVSGADGAMATVVRLTRADPAGMPLDSRVHTRPPSSVRQMPFLAPFSSKVAKIVFRRFGWNTMEWHQ